MSLTTSLSIENAEIEAAPYAVVSADVVVPSADSVTKGAAIIINSDEYNFASVSMSFFFIFPLFLLFFNVFSIHNHTHKQIFLNSKFIEKLLITDFGLVIFQCISGCKVFIVSRNICVMYRVAISKIVYRQ